jgi:hypothetical protein
VPQTDVWEVENEMINVKFTQTCLPQPCSTGFETNIWCEWRVPLSITKVDSFSYGNDCLSVLVLTADISAA